MDRGRRHRPPRRGRNMGRGGGNQAHGGGGNQAHGGGGNQAHGGGGNQAHGGGGNQAHGGGGNQAHGERGQQRPAEEHGDREHALRGGGRGQRGPARGHVNRGAPANRRPAPDRVVHRPAPDRVVHQISRNLLEQKTGEYEPQELMLWLGADRGVAALMNLKEPSAASRLALLKAVRKAVEAGRSESLNHLLIKFRESALFSHMSEFLCSASPQNMKERGRLEEITEVLVELLEKYMIFLPTDSHTAVLLIELVLEAKVIPSLGLERLLPNLARIKEMTEEAQKQPKNSSKKSGHKERLGQPPDDFREIPICPTAADLANEKPFLRVNRIKGNYKDLQTYLDVQFRLLREDLVKPLRDGILEFKNRKTEGRFRSQNVQVYTDVKILAPDCTPQGITHQVCFSLNGLEQVRWENSKRLIFGSLLCFSSDEFQTVIFGTVANRDPAHLKDGRIDVFFLEGDLDLSVRLTFVMVESSSYFEAYRHVLKALQEITEEALPFQRYLIGNRQTNVFDSDSEEDDAIKIVQDPPRYLDFGSKYDITPLMIEEYKQHGKAVAVRDLQKWPADEMFDLDSSQLAAVKSALTKELSIIQGPPGTGKTYVGLKVAEVLLRNSEMWDKSGPILVLCYTNHALDQFLEVILDFHPQGIVRVGSRSKNSRLDNFNLSTLRNDMLKERRVPIHLRRNFFDIREQQQAVEMRIVEASVRKEATRTKILSERELDLPNHVIDRLEQGYLAMNQPSGEFQLAKKGKRPKSFIVEWLGCGNNVKIQGQHFNNMVDDLLNNNEVMEENIEVGGEAMFAFDRRVDDEDEELMEFLKMSRERKKKILAKMDFGLDLNEENQDNQSDHEWQLSGKEKKRRRKFALKQLKGTSIMNDREKGNAERNLWQLTLEDRWKLYRTWIINFCQPLEDKIRRQLEEFNLQARRLKEIREHESIHIMKQSKVIGMTTTGAAKNHSLVQELKPSIVIVEEAAEVLEAHVIAGLASSVQHLILIGDHQQLRPSPTVFELSKHYNLDVSLFERLIKNNLSFDRLDIQHRMHPVISKLLVPHIYEDLHDHESVHEYPSIKGVSSNMFFVNHQKSEDYIQDGTSKQNDHEATYIVELCRYLIKQGHEKEKITILTTYSGQLFAFKKKMKKEEFLGVRVSTVDNYQGEESEIILLSLVRSNKEGSIGFLSIDNRVCVALSRAKHALYCIGNFGQLCEKAKLWTNIIKYVRQVSCVGPALKLACQLHPEYSREVSDPSDFKKLFPEGGCTKPCKFRLECGHTCQLTCHPGSPLHEDYKCRKGCARGKRDTCPLDHKCCKLCYQDCGSCPDPVEKTIPGCGHKQTMPCGDDPLLAQCRTPCAKLRMCGHRCERCCGDDCNQEVCRNKSTIKLICGHLKAVVCATKDAEHDCFKKCDQVLDCKHKCTGTCSRCKQGRLHVGCTENCGRLLVCGHVCRQPCGQPCFCTKQCETKCSHNRCEKVCGAACVPCKEPCSRGCIHSKCGKLCSEPCDMKPCMEPCHQILPCGHSCIGLCGEKCPRKCRVCHQQDITAILFGEEDEPDTRFVQLQDCKHIIHAESMDNWVETSARDDAVKLAECPKCKTPVRQTSRYNNTINNFLQNVEKVKAKLRGEDVGQLDKVKLRVLDELAAFVENNEELIEAVKTAVNNAVSVHQLLVIDQQTKMLEILEDCTENVKDSKKSLLNPPQDTSENLKSEKVLMVLLKEAAYMKNHLMFNLEKKLGLTEQQLREANNEVTRIQHLEQFFSAIRDREKRNLSFTKEAIQIMESIKHVLIDDVKPFCVKKAQQVKEMYKELKRKITGLGVSDIERRDIVAAMGESKGHWYKCPNGHVYLIGECGGATMQSKCNECGAAIGGGQHRLRRDNALATEMDGATQSAWPGTLY